MNAPNTQEIQAHCCRCGVPVKLVAAIDCDPELIDALAKMTTCDRCAGPERRRQPKRAAAEARQPHND